MLDLERRSGVREEDVDEFLEQAKEVERKIRELKEGKLEDILEEERKDREREEREALLKDKRRAEYTAREAKRFLEEKKTEREHWWRGAELLLGEDEEADEDDDGDKKRSRYETDYGRWAEWVPREDPATVEEVEGEERRRDEISNREFERANPEFCSQFLQDKKVRDEKAKKKEETAMAKRVRGNKFFKKGDWNAALTQYKESMTLKGYEPTTLLNIAQVYLKLKQFDDAIEFATRAAKVAVEKSKTHADFRAKAFYRRGLAHIGQGSLKDAVHDLKLALKEDGSQRDVVAARLSTLERQIVDDQNEKDAAARIESLAKKAKGGNVQYRSVHQAEEALGDQALEVVEEALRVGDDASMRGCAVAMRISSEARALFRTRGGIQLLCDSLGSQSTTAPADPVDGVFDLSSSESPSSSPTFTVSKKAALSALAAAIFAEVKSKQLAVEAGIVETARVELKGENSNAAAELVAELVSIEDECAKAVNLCDALVAALIEMCRTKADTLESLVGIAQATRALRDMAFRNKADESDVVVVLATCLLINGLDTKKTEEASIRSEIVEYAVAALCSLAKIPSLREEFAVGLTASETACGILLRVAKEHDSDAALSAVSNACFDTKAGARARRAAEASGAVAVCFGMILNDSKPPLLVARSAQLLARLTTSPESQTAHILQKSPKALPQLAEKLDSKEDGECAKIKTDAIIRTIAAALDPETRLDGSFFVSVANVLPEPCEDLGVVTARSVSQSTKTTPSVPTVCNACKVLIVALNSSCIKTEVANKLVDTGIHERLIAVLANYKDSSVRKNCAIVLAKLIGLVGERCKERVRQLRGLEMITTLGNDLLK